MKTPARNQDIKALETGLSALDRHEAINECKKLKQIEELGERYLLHKANAPKRGTYDHRGMPVLA